MKNDPKIIVALDFSAREEALNLVKKLDPKLCYLKVANTMFTHYGPEFVKELMSLGFRIFLDLKYYDIPSQVAGACRAAAELGVWMVNLHASGGPVMMKAAVDALKDFPKEKRPLLISVTVLTSMNAADLHALGIEKNLDELVIHLAKMSQEVGLDGVVCSAQEVGVLQAKLGRDFIFVTPGIRLSSNNAEDQKRIMTPNEALKAGSSYLVIGRSITQAKDPLSVLKNIYEMIA